jgi:ElaB/YqjD/DUF883 family membrane-anchored ribosome-binding protein
MTTSPRHQPEPNFSYAPESGPESSIEAENLQAKSVKLIDDVEQNLRAQQYSTVGHYAQDAADPFVERVGVVYDKAAERVSQFAQKTSERAQSGAQATAEAVKTHPVMTFAVIGGLATAAIAGASLFRSQRRDASQRQPIVDRDDLITAKPRKTVAKASSKRKAH